MKICCCGIPLGITQVAVESISFMFVRLLNEIVVHIAVKWTVYLRVNSIFPNGNLPQFNVSCRHCLRNQVYRTGKGIFGNMIMCEGFVFRVQLKCEKRYLAVLKDTLGKTEDGVTEINIRMAVV